MNSVYQSPNHDHVRIQTAFGAQQKLRPIKKAAKRVSEIIVPNANDNHGVILPIVASLSQNVSSSWTTWISYRTPSKKQLEVMGANLSHLRIIQIKENTDARWIIWQALAQGNSHAVIAEQQDWNKDDIADMEAAAKAGNTQGIFITLH